MSNITLTRERLKELLDYDPETGVFALKIGRGGKRIGAHAGTKTRDGYIRIMINGKKYSAHRLAWMYVYDCWPTNELDHINRVRDDNRLCNLREVTPSENQWNAGKRKCNKSGHIGVHWSKRAGRWKAQIVVNRKYKYLGYFDTPEEAHAAYVRAKAEHHRIEEAT